MAALLGTMRIHARLPPLDTYPRVVAFAETNLGCACLYVAFAGMLTPVSSEGPLLTFFAAACAFAGRYRRWMLALATLTFIAIHANGLQLIGFVLFVLFSAAAARCMYHFRDRAIVRWPVSCLVGTFFAAFLLAWSSVFHGLLQAVLWSFTFTFSTCIWYLAYALQDQKSPDRSPFAMQLGAFHPFWGSTAVPYGKGLSYLRKVEAKSSRELAVTQLKGIKLLVWAWVLKIVLFCLQTALHRKMHVPTFDVAFSMQMAGTPYPWYWCWGSLISTFFEAMLQLAIMGHIYIACARMAGFRLLRNTYRPLESQTIAEFWNRYYFYFKELLVDHFFYPTFLSIFKAHRRLRLVFATFMAAGVGNFLYHFIGGIGNYSADKGLAQTVWGFQTYAFYCLVLATGIAASQIRAQRTKRNGGWFGGRLCASTSVALFYCMLHIFDDTNPDYSLWDHFQFLFHLMRPNV
jgi:hypothetical protein